LDEPVYDSEDVVLSKRLDVKLSKSLLTAISKNEKKTPQVSGSKETNVWLVFL